MFGKVIMMELRTGWKGILLFTFIVLLMAGGMPQMFPTLMESSGIPLDGEENLDLVVPDTPGEDLSLSWTPMGDNMSYLIVESLNMSIYPPSNLFISTTPSIKIPHNFTGNRFYSVFTFNMSDFNFTEIFSLFSKLSAISTNDTDSSSFKFKMDNQLGTTFIGMTQIEKDESNPFDQLLENEVYEGLTGGRVTTMTEMRGFISLEFFSWWIFLAGLFFAYVSVSSLTSDFDGKRMDLIFSTPISRERYLLEKFIAMILVATFVLVIAAAAMWGAIEGTGYTKGLSQSIIFMAVVSSLPMLMVIMAIGFLSAVQFRSMRVGMGIAFLFIMVEFILYTVSQISPGAESAKYGSIMYYWDYNAVLYDGAAKVGDLMVLVVVTVVILMLAIWVFKKKDIPA
jgi:ABC-2 type transport system permease protein